MNDPGSREIELDVEGTDFLRPPVIEPDLADAWGLKLPAIPVPDPNSPNWPEGEEPTWAIDWPHWRSRRGAIWWQVVELSLSCNPGPRCVKDLGWGYVSMVSGKVYDLGHPNPLRERLEITHQFRDKLASIPALEPRKVSECIDPHLPGKSGIDWFIEWGRFRDLAVSRGWSLPKEFPVDVPFESETTKRFGPVEMSSKETRIPAKEPPRVEVATSSEELSGAKLDSAPKDWGRADENRLLRVREEGLDAWIREELEKGRPKKAIVVELHQKLGEPPPPAKFPLRSPYQRVIQALTPSHLASKEKWRGGSGR